jgi:GNAT superfamily N-acetyltransferase
MQIPDYEIRCYHNDDHLPDEAEELFKEELAYSREPLPDGRDEDEDWSFACVCAVTAGGHVLGGIHLDIGPINGGPLAREKLAIVEGVFVRPEYRTSGVGTAAMRTAIDVAREAGCLHMQCSTEWTNLAAIALYRKCGFALTDITDEDEGGEYFVIKSLG